MRPEEHLARRFQSEWEGQPVTITTNSAEYLAACVLAITGDSEAAEAARRQFEALPLAEE